jgi:hypothetical protein
MADLSLNSLPLSNGVFWLGGLRPLIADFHSHSRLAAVRKLDPGGFEC